MTGKQLLEYLSKMKEDELNSDIQIILCNPQSPTDDGDYDNTYYEYDIITNCSYNHKTRLIEIFGFI